MEIKDIIRGLEKQGFVNDGGATQLHQYTKTKRESLLSQSAGNRSNTSWGRGEYIIVPFQEDSYTKDDLLKGWASVVGTYKNQYLILEVDNSNNWEIYDYNSNLLGGNAYIEKILERSLSNPLQQIFYGAPGTGKSHKINRLTEGEEVIRTTFHPDSDYSTFVGRYKPHMEEVDKTTVIGKELIVVNDESGQPKKEKRIVYKYSCQAFLQAYIAAWQNPNKAQYLVIEEINRGNCAQIFGDIFQLLDRNDEGYSSYPIKTDADAENELRTLFNKEWNLTEEKAKEIEDLYSTHYPDGITKEIKNGSLLLLPKNLYIWATMNTSDQSLFPIDSAFKRRWDWKYVKIKNEHKDWKVDIDIKTKDSAGNETTAKLDWYEFIDKINEIIASMTSSADKQLGYFFCKPKTKDSKEIDAETFVSKVIFYLWNDVFKDYAFEDASLFQYTIEVNGNKETKDLTFPDFYNDDESINTTCLTDFIEKVLNWKKGNEDKE